MPIRLVNTCEQGADGAAPLDANNGRRSGNAWSAVAVSGGVLTTTAQFVHGTKSLKLNVTPLSDIQGVTWSETSFTLSNVTTVYMRFYFRLESLPSGVHRMVTIGSAIGANYLGGLLIKPNGTLDLTDGSVTARATTSTLALNQWYRLEIRLVSHATSGAMTVRLFTGANLEGTTPDETVSYSNQNTNGAAAQWFNIGGTATNNTFGMWLDSVEVTDVGYPGPFAPPIPAEYETLFSNGAYPFWTPNTMDQYADTSTYTMGMYFTPAVSGRVYGVAWCNHRNATSTDGGVTPQIAIYPGPSGGTSALVTKTSTNTEVRANWNYDLFGTPLAVTGGTTYMAVVLRKNYPYETYLFDAGNGGIGTHSQGNLTAPGSTGANNNFFSAGGSLSKPTTAFQSTWYGLDVLFRPNQSEAWGLPIN